MGSFHFPMCNLSIPIFQWSVTINAPKIHGKMRLLINATKARSGGIQLLHLAGEFLDLSILLPPPLWSFPSGSPPPNDTRLQG